ncbi:putative heme d1 biosynthesis radical SAM protein NirJ2 [Tepidibacter thalassicus DSM 15285]|uniref:Putative heme d1 biosynthesis radical SAM protein NirJ2 n=2 Tax=Tepidibacter TaxID=214904 RepID=A0A1M5SNW9_9FIRM|nr:putative heme d1 biosynthesis radical SAM protein NirJ2 [Tepidibacter thalassicus DSM 15285]
MTKNCNLYCKHCYRDAGPNEKQKDELDTKESKELIKGIAKAGFKILIFSGGEPLLREDLFELTEYAHSLGLIVGLGTNGTLITKEIAKKLKESKVRAVAISLDSLDENKHDEFRQVKGSFKDCIRGIKESINAGLKVQINTTVTKSNYEEITKITDYISSLGGHSHHPFFLVEVGRGKNIGKEGLNKKEYKEIINRILDKQKNTHIELKPTCAPQFMVEAKEKGMDMRFSRGCIAGIKYCCILPNGDVHICPYLPIKVGSVREKPFDVIWEQSEIFNKLRDYKNYKGNCGSCKNINICGGCRARAFSKTGDYLQEDTFCLKGDD